MRILAAVSMVFVAAHLQGCLAPLAIGAVGTGAYFGSQERGFSQGIHDSKIKLSLKKRLTETDANYFTSISADVLNGDVLLTGIVPTTTAGGEVLDIVRRTPDVKNIYNELFVAPGYPASRKAKDTWLATKIKGRLFTEKEVYQVNYMLSVVNSHVYVLGLAQSDAEHAHVIHVLRTTPGVAKVHDYITLAPSAQVQVPREEAGALAIQQRDMSWREKMENFWKNDAKTQAPDMLPAE